MCASEMRYDRLRRFEVTNPRCERLVEASGRRANLFIYAAHAVALESCDVTDQVARL
jgi:hypothetical protein